MDIPWLIGTAIALFALVGGVIARDRYVLRLIATEVAAVKKDCKEDTNTLHERLNRVRDEYVRRTDMDNHIVRLDQSVQQLASELRLSSTATNQRLDALMAHLVKSSGSNNNNNHN